MKHIIVGTAGHIDHRKTALVKALTGIDTDRTVRSRGRYLYTVTAIDASSRHNESVASEAVQVRVP